MSYLLWHEQGPAVASTRRLFSAQELPSLADAEALRTRLAEQAWQQDTQRQEALQQARQDGRAQGLAEGRRAALLTMQQAWDQALAALEDAQAQSLEAQRADVAMLALQVARKLIGQLPEPEQLARLAEEAARGLLPGAAPLQLRIHPAHETAVRELLAPSLDAGLTLRADAALPRQACRLSSALGEADAALHTQLARIAASWGLDTWQDASVDGPQDARAEPKATPC